MVFVAADTIPKFCDWNFCESYFSPCCYIKESEGQFCESSSGSWVLMFGVYLKWNGHIYLDSALPWRQSWVILQRSSLWDRALRCLVSVIAGHPVTCSSPFWGSRERRTWGGWKHMKRPSPPCLPCFSLYHRNFVMLLPQVFSHLYNTCFVFIILVISSLSPKEKLGINSDLLKGSYLVREQNWNTGPLSSFSAALACCEFRALFLSVTL